MPTQCRIVPADKRDKEPGDMWFSDITGEDGNFYCEEGRLSDEYVRDHMANRKPLIVMIPARAGDSVYPYPFGIDTSTSEGTRRHGWTVSGEPPNITVHPSIHLPGHYHGWLQNGVLSDG